MEVEAIEVKLDLCNMLSDFTDFWNYHQLLVNIPTRHSMPAVRKAITMRNATKIA